MFEKVAKDPIEQWIDAIEKQVNAGAFSLGWLVLPDGHPTDFVEQATSIAMFAVLRDEMLGSE